jgi:hypothetical protein
MLKKIEGFFIDIYLRDGIRWIVLKFVLALGEKH